MAGKDVFRIVTVEGHEYDYHGNIDQLKEAHPGAQITGRRMVSDVGEGTYEPYSIAKARAVARKTAKADEDAGAERRGATPAIPATPATPAKANKGAKPAGDGAAGDGGAVAPA